jgi:hypothetical protein
MSSRLLKKYGLVFMLSGALLAPAGSAWARGRDDGYSRKHRDGRREVVVVGRDRYYYRSGHFTRPGWFGFEFKINMPPVGVIVSSIPIGHKTVIVGSATYCYYDHVYYRSCPTGYVVVPAPATNAQVVYVPAASGDPVASGSSVTINVPNADGSLPPVTLTSKNNGYVG